MINKRIIIGIILFIVGGLIVFTFANPSPDEEPIPNVPEEEEPIIPEEPEEPVIPVIPVVPVVPVTPVTPEEPNEVGDLTAQIAAARAAVVRAESTLTQTDVDRARDLVTDLPGGPTKTGFNARLSAVQDQINLAKQYADAIAAVVLAETTKLQADVNTAAELVAALPAGGVKTDLTSRLVVAQTSTNLAAQIALATEAVIKAEGSKLQADVDAAYVLVNALPTISEKTALIDRLVIVQAFIDLSDEKLVAIATLNAYVIAKGQSNYSEANWASVLTHQTNGVNAINASITAIQIDTALANAKANVGAVVTVLATAKSLAIADLNKLIDDLTEEYYTVENWTTIQSYKTRAIAAINGATTVAQIRNIHTIATAKINEIEMMLEPTKMWAIANVNALVASLVQTDYTAANWANILYYQNKAFDEITASTTVERVMINYNNRTGKIKAVESILDTAKLLAIEEINDIVDDLDAEDYYAANWTMIVDFQSAGIVAINASTTVPMVRSAFTLARTNIETVETEDEVDARLLAEARPLAITSINSLVAGLIQTDYTVEIWAKILEYQGEAIVEINAATTVAEVQEALAYRTRKIEEKLTILETAKAWAIEELDDLVDGLDVYDYTDANWTMIFNYRRAGIVAIDASTTAAMVTSAYTLARTNIEAVPVDLTSSEEEAIAAVEKYERKLDNDYRSDARAAVEVLDDSALKTALDARIDEIKELLETASSEVVDKFLVAINLVEEFEDIPTVANKNAARTALNLIQTYTAYNGYYIVGNLESRYTQVVNAM